MTRPIYEPSYARTDRKLGFGSDQLFRRPAPASGAGDVPWARRWLTSNESIASGTNDELIIWDADDVNDTDYFSIISTTALRCKLQGLYEITAELVWDSNKVEGSVVTLNSNSAHGFFFNKGWWDEQNAGHTIEHNQTFTYQRRLETNTDLKLYVVHFAAVARTIQGSAGGNDSYMEVRYLGSWNGTPAGD